MLCPHFVFEHTLGVSIIDSQNVPLFLFGDYVPSFDLGHLVTL